MEIFLVPFLIALFYHLLPGTWYGIVGISEHPNKLRALAQLAVKTAVFSAIGFLTPYLLYIGRSVFAADLMMLQILVGVGLMAYGYARRSNFAATDKPDLAIVVSASFIAAGLIPVVGFAVGDQLTSLLSIKLKH